MGRILAIDYGTKRCGIAVTDPLKLIASGLTTLPTAELTKYIQDYINSNEVETIVIGLPKKTDNTPSENAQHVVGFMRKLKKLIPGIPVISIDERFTSSMAQQTMVSAGATRKQRQNKGKIDMISATIILQHYLETKNFQE